MSDALERKYSERSWALSVFIAKIDRAAAEQMCAAMDPDDVARLLRVIEGYGEDIAIRDLIGPGLVDEDPR